MTDLQKLVRKNKAKKDEPPYEPYTEVGLTKEFRDKVVEYKTLGAVEEQAKKDRKKLSQEIQDQLSERGRDRVLIRDDQEGNPRKVLAYEGSTSWIDKALLVELGVGMDVIEKATKTTNYITIGVYPVKD